MSSGSMKFDGVGWSWYHPNQPSCGRLLESHRDLGPEQADEPVAIGGMARGRILQDRHGRQPVGLAGRVVQDQGAGGVPQPGKRLFHVNRHRVSDPLSSRTQAGQRGELPGGVATPLPGRLADRADDFAIQPATRQGTN